MASRSPVNVGVKKDCFPNKEGRGRTVNVNYIKSWVAQERLDNTIDLLSPTDGFLASNMPLRGMDVHLGRRRNA